MSEKALQVLLIEDNPGDARLVKEMLSDVEGASFEVQWAEDLVSGLDRLSHAAFDVALVDLTLPDSHGMETFTAIRAHAPRVPVILLTGLDSDELALHAVESGAQDYLVKGRLGGESLARALRYAVLRHTQQAEVQEAEHAPARITGVLGAKGGVGTTTLACHFALELKRLAGDHVLLADLDVSSAAAAFLLKVDTRYSLLDASTNLHRLDAAMWKSMIWSSPDGLDAIQPPGAVRLGEQLNGERVRHVMRFVRSLYQSIVIDLGRFNAASMYLLEDLDELLLVTTPDVQSLFDAKRILQRTLDLGVGRERISLVVNRFDKRGDISRELLERALGFPIAVLLPESHQELHLAYSDGKMLGEDTVLRRQIGQIVAKLRGIEEKPVARRSLPFLRLSRG